MTNEFDYNKLIEDYLNGSLSESEKAGFESRLKTDPSLKGEFELQKDLLSVIKHARMTELKTTLASIHVPWYYLMPAGLKIAAFAAIVSVAGLSTYYYVEHTGNNKIQDAIITKEYLSNPANTITYFDNNNKPGTGRIAEIPEPVIRNSMQGTGEKTRSNIISEKPVTESRTSPVPQINVPQPDIDQNAGDLNASNPAMDNTQEFDKTSTPKIEDKVLTVKATNSKEYNFNYSFTEGNLTLYGNFSGSPYKILEINSSNGKQYYLVYNGDYYSLEQNTKTVKPLIKVTDADLISQLEILKNNK